MDNKNKAEKYMVLAEHYMRNQKYEEAARIARKALKLYPMKKAEDLLAKVLSKQNQKPKSTELEPECSQSNSEYTEEQLEHVKRIKKTKDYYEILGVRKDATKSDINKAYKKLALQLHPDKNKAPGATEAFKAIGNAVAILTDTEKRKQYDMYGPEEERMQNAHSPQGTNDDMSDILGLGIVLGIVLIGNMCINLFCDVSERNQNDGRTRNDSMK